MGSFERVQMPSRKGRACISRSWSVPHLIKFLEVMRGTRTAAPTRLLPVMKMPLCGKVTTSEPTKQLAGPGLL